VRTRLGPKSKHVVRLRAGLTEREVRILRGGCVKILSCSSRLCRNNVANRAIGRWKNARTIPVAFISIPELRVNVVQQRYTRLETGRYRYEGLDSGFTAEISVDEEGLVIDYPQLCRRVWPRS
jgi:hypothetical protein